jgi:hypothetical protein
MKPNSNNIVLPFNWGIQKGFIFLNGKVYDGDKNNIKNITSKNNIKYRKIPC